MSVTERLPYLAARIVNEQRMRGARMVGIASAALLAPNDRQAVYGVVYLRALATQAGCGSGDTPAQQDVQALDAFVRWHAGIVECQVKTTYQHAIEGSNDIRWPVDPAWIAKWKGPKYPIYFVVVVVPNDSRVWLNHSTQGTMMHRTAAYWCRINADEFGTSTTIVVPRAQRLDTATFDAWHEDLLNCYRPAEAT